jgi:hypothetical protein
MATAKQRKATTTATATATATKQGQQAKQAAPVQQVRTYPKVPKGFGTHGMYNAQGQLNQQGHVPAAQAFMATPKALGVASSILVPKHGQPVVLVPPQPSMLGKYQSAVAAVTAGFAAAQKAHGNNVTAAQVMAHIPPWPVAKPKPGSAWRHALRALAVAWQA